MLNQTEQGRERRHDPPLRLLLGQPVEQRHDLNPAIVQERLDLVAFTGSQDNTSAINVLRAEEGSRGGRPASRTSA